MACVNTFRKHKGHLRYQISIYSNISLYKKGTFHHKKGTLVLLKFRGHVPPPPSPRPPEHVGRIARWIWVKISLIPSKTIKIPKFPTLFSKNRKVSRQFPKRRLESRRISKADPMQISSLRILPVFIAHWENATGCIRRLANIWMQSIFAR